MTEFQDKEIPCVDCPNQELFVLTAGEQEFFASKGFTLPKRCKLHRKQKSASMRQKSNGQDNYNQGQKEEIAQF